MHGPQFSILTITGLWLLISQSYMPGLSKISVISEIFYHGFHGVFFSFLEEEMENLALQTTAVNESCVKRKRLKCYIVTFYLAVRVKTL
jgi:hypothetical protein